VALEPAIGPLELPRCDVEPLPVALDQLDASVVADAVRDPRPDEVSGHACHDYLEQREATVGNLESCEQHDRLARGGDAGAVEQHQHEDPRETEVADHVRREVDEWTGQRGYDEGGQGSGTGASVLHGRVA